MSCGTYQRLTVQHAKFNLCFTVSGAEDPEKLLDQAVNEMQSDLVRLRQASAQVHSAFILRVDVAQTH